MGFEGAEPSEQGESVEENGDGITVKDYYNIIIQLRKTSLLFQQISSVPVGELTMLLTIYRQIEEAGEARVSSLGSALKLSRPAVSRMLHNLKKKGYVQMKNNEKDQRFLYVYFTDKGREILDKEMSFACGLMRKIQHRMGDKCMKEYLCCTEKFHEILSEEVQNMDGTARETKTDNKRRAYDS